MIKNGNQSRAFWKRFGALFLSVSLLLPTLAGCGGVPDNVAVLEEGEVQAPEEEKKSAKVTEETPAPETEEETTENLSEIMLSERPSLVGGFLKIVYDDVKPALPAYTVEPDFSNVINIDQYSYLNDAVLTKLSKNNFVVMPWGGDEFFDLYEPNRYDYIPNFITVDAMLHTYHLYFAYLLKRTEQNELSDIIADLSEELLEGAKEQYETLKGTEWEEAALTNMAFFAVPCAIYNPRTEIPAEAEEFVEADLSKIEKADGIDYSAIFDSQEDFSQYKPRGYYDTDETLKKYFKAMMWYGRMGFSQKSEKLNRAALLITLLLQDEELKKDWERVYQVTAFVAGTSDDSGIYEYAPIVESVFGKNVSAEDLIGDEKGYEAYHELTDQLPPPRINSVPVYMADSDEEVRAKNTGFRFMGQRFTIDASIFGALIYRSVMENSMGDLRMLPDALDIPAAFGSEAAVKILEDEGNMDYANYEDNLKNMQQMVAEAPESTWNASLSSQWLNTLRPLLTSKGEGYPSFMQSEEWDKKNLTSFLGSYTELKHDTILYAKQIMAEMGDGGDEPEVRDDRGYVEPEPEVFARLKALVQATREGFEYFNLLENGSRSDLVRLEELADKLRIMSEKELKGELLSDEEYELIRDFGGQIEHFWQVAKRDEAENEYFSSYEFPASLVVDVATDPNGSVLELGTGNPALMYVVIEVDGKLKIAEGAVFPFYEFTWPMENRLTDGEWRKIIGVEWDETGEYYDKYNDQITQPVWTESFRVLPDEY
ncbi:MAG: DUF3160 domain-containing protein [Lachnospiraceae bacterium]|nr:DUF3160 domain-containing protein [Lachnospiraceae bacterium]